ncbi:Xaa-Pro aminopeptidase [filamentous cyanobacterium CCP5]|nr:Xaa-Pro aminopeptidase [filamentous cyanobacterium CCP5]
MQTQIPPLAETLRHRRQRLGALIDFPALIWAGEAPARNFPANRYPYRASSHFLYFVGLPLEGAAVLLNRGQITLFWDEPGAGAALWHGPMPSRDEIAAQIGAADAYPRADLQPYLAKAAVLPGQKQMVSLPKRDIPSHLDQQLAAAVVELRLIHDGAAIAEIERAAAVSVAAHKAGMAATAAATTEAQVRAAMEGMILAHNLSCAYSSIVTVHGEVLHNEHYDHRLQSGDLLLADVGAETPSGWASDITRTWPVSGQFSPSQRAIYDVVLAAHDACIAAAKPGIEYRDIHLLGAKAIAEGLVELGILRGNPEDLVAQDAHALFFPHGIGHLLGLDVHDMEDLGDLAGYAPGRERSDRFGLAFLRLDRPLRENMIVTIEPGFYQVPGILNDPGRRATYQSVVNWERLAEFSDVRGIRIEDDVLITAKGTQVVTADLPTAAADIEALVTD